MLVFWFCAVFINVYGKTTFFMPHAKKIIIHDLSVAGSFHAESKHNGVNLETRILLIFKNPCTLGLSPQSLLYSKFSIFSSQSRKVQLPNPSLPLHSKLISLF